MPAVWARLTAALPDAWVRRAGDAYAGVTGVPVADLNGVWLPDRPPGPAVVEVLLDEVAVTGLPHCLQVRPAPPAAVVELAGARRMERGDDIPLMVLDDATAVAGLDVSELAIRRLRPEEAEGHTAVAAAAFGAPPELLARVVTPATLGLAGVSAYVGEVGGHPVVTGFGVAGDDGGVGVFSIATDPAHRRLGYGAAITARIVRDAVADGSTWAWLQSSESGYGVYERLGFRTIERWPVWRTPSAPASEL